MNNDQKVFGIATKSFIIREDKLLILYKAEEEAIKDPDPSRRMDTPGGRLEFGESPESSLLREVKEESGLTVNILFPLDVWHYVHENFQLVGIDYLCEWIGGEVALGEEHESFEWLTLDEILDRKWKDKEKYEKIFRKYTEYNGIQKT